MLKITRTLTAWNWVACGDECEKDCYTLESDVPMGEFATLEEATAFVAAAPSFPAKVTPEMQDATRHLSLMVSPYDYSYTVTLADGTRCHQHGHGWIGPIWPGPLCVYDPREGCPCGL